MEFTQTVLARSYASGGLSPETLRQQFATNPLARLGWSFERAMAVPAIAKSIACGAREAERASQINRAARHWTERPD